MRGKVPSWVPLQPSFKRGGKRSATVCWGASCRTTTAGEEPTNSATCTCHFPSTYNRTPVDHPASPTPIGSVFAGHGQTLQPPSR